MQASGDVQCSMDNHALLQNPIRAPNDPATQSRADHDHANVCNATNVWSARTNVRSARTNVWPTDGHATSSITKLDITSGSSSNDKSPNVRLPRLDPNTFLKEMYKIADLTA